jgi:hypothetical protein
MEHLQIFCLFFRRSLCLEPVWLQWLLGDEVGDPVTWQHSRLRDPLYINFNARLALRDSNQSGHYLHKPDPIQESAARTSSTGSSHQRPRCGEAPRNRMATT